MPLFLSVGEVMIELSDAGGGLMRRGIAGDTFNTAHYARLCLPEDWQVGYLTGLGRDRASADMLAAIGGSRIGTRFIRFDDRRGPGLYMIHLDNGERSFSYWRDRSAARLLAEEPGHLATAFAEADIIYVSGITLAILEGEGRNNLLSALGTARARGARIAFDPNIRPRLWEDAGTMRGVLMKAAATADIVLPGYEDEATHFGDASRQACIERYRQAGAGMVVLKDGAAGVTVATTGAEIRCPAERVEKVVDTTAAGDSFNAAFLARLATGGTTLEAARAGARLAAQVIASPGAIVPVDTARL